MNFEQLLDTLLDEARARISNGQFTVSGLARLAGISQPHMHHILLGKRGLQPVMADRLLDALSLDIAGLAEVAARGRSPAGAGDFGAAAVSMSEPAVMVPLMEGLIGRGYPLPVFLHPPKYLPLPRAETPRDCALCAARLAHDPALTPLFLHNDLVVIAMSPLPPDLQGDIASLSRVVTSGSYWRVLRPEGEARASATATGAPSPDRGESGQAGHSLVGVVSLTIRRMRPLRLAFSR